MSFIGRLAKKSVPGILGVFLLEGCLFGSPEDQAEPLYPNSQAGKFVLFANDHAKNDSASEWLARGIVLLVQPQGSYQLSFDHPASEKKIPVLQLFRTVPSSNQGKVSVVHVRTVEGIQQQGRLVYSFDCAELAPAQWMTVLEYEGTWYTGSTANASLQAQGPWPLQLSLNLILAGDYEGPSDARSPQILADSLLAAFRAVYARGNIIVDTIFVRNASQHPEFGALFPVDESVISTFPDHSFDLLGDWPEPALRGALDLVIVRRFDKSGVLGMSPVPGRTLAGRESSTIIIATHLSQFGVESRSTLSEIVTTAIHESGHFFGLRHTTSTAFDLESGMDWSNVEDGLSDTPFCRDLPTLFKANIASTPYANTVCRMAFGTTAHCPDAENLMFPASMPGQYEHNLSDEQLQIVAQSLGLMPR